MRLIDTETGKFVEVVNVDAFKYAILSHTWDQAGEQTLQDVRSIQLFYDHNGRRLNPDLMGESPIPVRPPASSQVDYVTQRTSLCAVRSTISSVQMPPPNIEFLIG